MFNIGEQVETINGVGTIKDIRNQGGEIVYLIETKAGGFSHGVSDVYSEDEFQKI